jgi:hypothetical protein
LFLIAQVSLLPNGAPIYPFVLQSAQRTGLISTSAIEDLIHPIFRHTIPIFSVQLQSSRAGITIGREMLFSEFLQIIVFVGKLYSRAKRPADRIISTDWKQFFEQMH